MSIVLRAYRPLVGRIPIMKNLAILGALVYIMAMGSGPFSLKSEQHTRRQDTKAAKKIRNNI